MSILHPVITLNTPCHNLPISTVLVTISTVYLLSIVLFSDDFYNKPWGLKHWLQHADPPIPPHTVIALLDPDMIFVRPLTPQMRGQPNNVYNKHLYKTEEDILDRIVEGNTTHIIIIVQSP